MNREADVGDGPGDKHGGLTEVDYAFALAGGLWISGLLQYPAPHPGHGGTIALLHLEQAVYPGRIGEELWQVRRAPAALHPQLDEQGQVAIASEPVAQCLERHGRRAHGEA